MENHNMFMDWKAQFWKDASSPQIHLQDVDFSDIKTSYKATVINTVSLARGQTSWLKDRIESPEMDPHILLATWFLTKMSQQYSAEGCFSFFNKWCWINWI